ncbi:UvrD-helicase domain-containing protein [Streptomyces sp. OM5714]|uniref:HelD family protein n=1 Tax=Streptomyces sp. OM5714 TaxID=2602736 RepID=UPI0013DAA438|nr:UvrD-helicase domain-containing protein [Streptomyces sp. OM5714]KAF2776180.1 Superfamily I DNA and RNA helicase [Streptomyces sp. OM5714]
MPKRTRRVDVLAVEQRAVDHAYRCLEHTRREAESLKGVSAAASGKDAIDVNRAWESELSHLDLKGNALVFMRADVDEGTGRKSYYIGRRVVFDEERNPAVISWSSPAAIEWRLTSEQEPGDVRLLRRIVCDERIVQRYLDLHGTDGASFGPRRAVPEEPEGTMAESPGDVCAEAGEQGPAASEPKRPEETSEFEEPDWIDPLLEELDRARDGAMHDIVETIQRDQLRLVSERPGGVLIVQGGPGTGKTAVGMHRVSWLLDNRHVTQDDILVVGPSRGFLDYASRALVELGSPGVTMLELPALWSGGNARRDRHETAVVKSDARMARVLRRAVDNHTTTTVERLEALVGGPEFVFELRRREVVVAVAEIAAIAAAALSGDSPYRVRQERCAQQLVQHLTRVYIGMLPGPADTDYFPEVRQLRSVTRLLRRIAPDLSARDVLRRLLAGGAALAMAAEGILTPEQQTVLADRQGGHTSARAAREATLEDLVCLDELEYLLSGRPERTYGHVVVDEAQDLTPMQARSLARRCPGGSMTILGDLAQATGPFPYQDWEELGTALTGRDGWRVAELLTGFRVPGEVMNYVRPLGTHCAPGVGVPDSVRRTGTEVTVVQGGNPARSAAEQALAIATGPDGARRRRTTGVIVPDMASWREAVATAVSGQESVSVLTADEAKGLEFDHVVVAEPSAVTADDPAGPRRLYVALTRCTQSLTVVHQRPLPHWIGGPVNPVPTPKQFLAQVSRRKSPHGTSGLCTRHQADGTRCANETRQADGWCRQPGCAGFRTAEPASLGRSDYLGVPKDGVTETRLELTPEQIADIRITSAACGAFVVRHRGSLGEAAVELHAMLAPFLAEGRHFHSPDGWFLDLQGYRLLLDVDARAVKAYVTGHPERSYAQVAAGVPSRVGREARMERRSALTAPETEAGLGLTDDAAVRAIDTYALHVTQSACASFERLAQSAHLADEAFVTRLREELMADLATGRIEWVDDRPFVEGERCQWWMRPDGRVLTTVCSSGTEIYGGHEAREADEPSHEGKVMPTTGTAGEATTGVTTQQNDQGLAGMVAERERSARADRAHESLRHRLLADLYEGPGDVGETAYADAWSHGPDGTTLFEVLADGAPTYERIREAALHLLEASSLHPQEPAEYLVLVLREPPADPWAVDACDRALSVDLVWRDGDAWAGPAAERVRHPSSEGPGAS